MELIKKIFPNLYLKRQISKLRLEALERSYDAGQKSNFYRPLRGYSIHPNRDMESAGRYMRARARYFDENHDLVIGIFDTLVLNIVGNSIPLRPLVRRPGGELHTEVNNLLKRLWIDWGRKPTICGTYSINQALKLAARAWLRDGEFLTRFVRGTRVTHPSGLPFSLELIEADFLPYEKTEEGKESPKIVQGVELNRYGGATAYHLYKTHPGNNFSSEISLDTKRVLAKDIVFLKFTRRAHQVRGVTLLHGVLNRLDDLKDYEESERIAARVAAAMTGYIEKEGESITSPGTDGERTFEMSPGLIFDNLLPGEKVGTIASNRPNPGLIDFRSAMLKAISAGTGTNCSTISRDYNGTYSSQRQELLETKPAYESLRAQFIDGYLWPIWDEFIQVMRVANLIPTDGIDLQTLTDVEARGIDIGWIDPKKQADATAISIQTGLTTRGQVIREQGGDPQAVFAEIKEEERIFGPLAKELAAETENTEDEPENTENQD